MSTFASALASLQNLEQGFQGTLTPVSSPADSTGATVQPVNVVTNTIGQAASNVVSSIFSTRVIAIVVGLIMIAGAIFLFGTSEIFSSPTAKAVIKGATE